MLGCAADGAAIATAMMRPASAAYTTGMLALMLNVACLQGEDSAAAPLPRMRTAHGVHWKGHHAGTIGRKFPLTSPINL